MFFKIAKREKSLISVRGGGFSAFLERKLMQ
jgi:hypothetical protein